MATIEEFDTKIDSRRRLTLPETGFEYYHVSSFDDGRIVLEPRRLVAPESISRRTLKTMDRVMDEMDAGNVSEPVDPSALRISADR
jgi:hypothetical protein